MVPFEAIQRVSRFWSQNVTAKFDLDFLTNREWFVEQIWIFGSLHIFLWAKPIEPIPFDIQLIQIFKRNLVQDSSLDRCSSELFFCLKNLKLTHETHNIRAFDFHLKFPFFRTRKTLTDAMERKKQSQIIKNSWKQVNAKNILILLPLTLRLYEQRFFFARILNSHAFSWNKKKLSA